MTGGISIGPGLGLASSTGGGVPPSITENGVTYFRISFDGAYLDQQVGSQYFYGSLA